MVGLAGKILDAGLNTFVIGFGTQFLHTGVGVVVDDLWTKVRDIFNLTFIFGLVYIGFKMILNSDDSGTRKWLINIIMAALLVNFSLYITKFIVDVTNITATQIAVGGFGMTGTPPQVQISTALMSNFGLTTVFGGDGTRTLESLGVTQGGGWGYIFGEMILFIIAAFVFAAGGLMLMIRYAALVLYMVLSPMMFLGWVFPGLQSVTSTYWKGFLGRAFFAPVYVLLVYFGAEIIRYYFSTSAAGNQSNFQNVLSGQGSAISQSFSNTIPPFILSCIFLLAAVVVGNKLGADGASTAIRMGNNVTNWSQRKAKGLAVGTAKMAAAPVVATGGVAARRASYGLGTGLEKGLARLRTSDSKMVRGLGASMGAKDAAKKMKEAKFGRRYTAGEIDKSRAAAESEYNDHKTITAGLDAQKQKAAGKVVHPSNGRLVDLSSLTPDQQKAALEAQEAALATMQTTINEMSAAQVEAMYNNQPEQFAQIVGNFKSSQVDRLMDSDGLNPDQKNKIFGARRSAIEASLTANGKDFNEEVSKLSVKQIETLGDEWIKDNAALFTKSQMDDLQKSEKFTEGQKNAHLVSRGDGQKAMVADSAGAARLFKTTKRPGPGAIPEVRKAKDIAQFSAGALLSPNALPYIDSSVLEEIYLSKSLNAEQRVELRNNILSATETPENKRALDSAKRYFDSPRGKLNWGDGNAPTPPPAAQGNPSSLDTDSELTGI